MPVAVNEVSVPSEVMFGCADAETVPAVTALPTAPIILAPGIFVSPAPDPIKRPDVVIFPITSRYNRSSTTFRLEYNTLELSVVPVSAPAAILVAVIPVNSEPLPIK